jgi:hypothetical protein
MFEVVRDGAREALRRLRETHARYEGHANPEARDALVDAAKTAAACIATLTAVDRVERGWDA